jgi:hypothetical protein
MQSWPLPDPRCCYPSCRIPTLPRFWAVSCLPGGPSVRSYGATGKEGFMPQTERMITHPNEIGRSLAPFFRDKTQVEPVELAGTPATGARHRSPFTHSSRVAVSREHRRARPTGSTPRCCRRCSGAGCPMSRALRDGWRPDGRRGVCQVPASRAGPTEYKVAARGSRALAGSPRVVSTKPTRPVMKGQRTFDTVVSIQVPALVEEGVSVMARSP